MRKITFIASLLAASLLIFSCATKKSPQTVDLPPLPPTPTLKITAAPTLVLKAAPPGAAFYDDFASGANTPWLFYQGSHTFTSGMLRLTCPINSGEYAYVRTNWINLSISSDIKFASGGWGAGVGGRYNYVNGANYQVWLYKSGRLTIEKYPTSWFDGWQELASATITAPGTSTHNVKLTITNNILTAYYDNVQTLTYTDNSSPIMDSGGICLSIWSSTSQTTANFDNVTVYSYDAAPVTNTPPVIQSANIRQIVYQGTNATVNVTATGVPLNYQWYYGNSLIAGATNSSYTIVNAKYPANQGNYLVWVTNNLGKVSTSGTVTVLPTNILAQCINTNIGYKTSVTLAWCPSPTDPTNAAIAGYKIYYGADGNIPGWTPTIYSSTNCPATIVSNGTNWFRTYTNAVTVGNVTNATVTNLAGGVTYYFAATAYDTNGLESDFSEEIAFTNTITGVTNPVWKGYSLTIRTLTDGTPEIQTKVCPFQTVIFQYKTNIMGTWFASTNITADAYGNVLFDDYTYPIRFYRAYTP